MRSENLLNWRCQKFFCSRLNMKLSSSEIILVFEYFRWLMMMIESGVNWKFIIIIILFVKLRIRFLLIRLLFIVIIIILLLIVGDLGVVWLLLLILLELFSGFAAWKLIHFWSIVRKLFSIRSIFSLIMPYSRILVL